MKCAPESVPRGSDTEDAPASMPQNADAPLTRPLRVLVITEDDPIYVIEFFRAFFAELRDDELKIVGITIDRAFHEQLSRTVQRLLRFYGWAGTLRQGLRFVSARVRGESIEALAERHGVPLVPARSVNDPEYLDRIRALGPDVILSVAGAEIFSRDLLSLPPLGCVNIHSGRLPAYRGMMPTFWQMRHGEAEITVTVHRMVERLDAGDVLATARFPVRKRDSLDRVIRETKRLGAQLLIRILREMREGRLRPVPLEMSQAGYFRFPGRADVRAFRKMGHRLI